MKTLFILRHAKSSWDHPDLSDFNRPLNKRGRKAAHFMGELMAARKMDPEFVICSPAIRAKQTIVLVGESSRGSGKTLFDERIYGASTNSLVYLVSEIEDQIQTAMIVGHNPGLESLVGSLCNEHPRLTTANLAIVELMINSWREIQAGTGKLLSVIRPREERKLLKSISK